MTGSAMASADISFSLTDRRPLKLDANYPMCLSYLNISLSSSLKQTRTVFKKTGLCYM